MARPQAGLLPVPSGRAWGGGSSPPTASAATLEIVPAFVEVALRHGDRATGMEAEARTEGS